MADSKKGSRARLSLLFLALATCGLCGVLWFVAIPQRVARFCKEVQPGDPAGAVEAHAREHDLRVRSVRSGTLVYGQVLFLRWHCIVEHQGGRVTSAETGFTQGT